MSKTTRQFIKVSIVGYIPAANILNKESIEQQFERLKGIKNFTHESMEIERFDTKPVGRLVAAEPEMKPDDAPHLDENLNPIKGDGVDTEEE